MANYPRLTISSDRAPLVSLMLQTGLATPVRTGLSVRELITKELCIDAEYLEHRIQTIFLNGHAVDDMDGSLVMDGDVLALSAAMPGVAGATMRRGGVYARMRAGITYCRQPENTAHETGLATVKLFNVLIPEIGPLLLARGCVMSPEQLGELLRGFPPDTALSLSGPDGQALPAPGDAITLAREHGQLLVACESDG